MSQQNQTTVNIHVAVEQNYGNRLEFRQSKSLQFCSFEDVVGSPTRQALFLLIQARQNAIEHLATVPPGTPEAAEASEAYMKLYHATDYLLRMEVAGAV